MRVCSYAIKYLPIGRVVARLSLTEAVVGARYPCALTVMVYMVLGNRPPSTAALVSAPCRYC